MTVRLIQVTDVSTGCKKEELRALFAHLGRIEELHLFPDSETLTASIGAKVAYIKFDKNDSAYYALQLSNTVFLDRPIICSLVKSGKVPDETEALKYCAPLNPNVMLMSGGATWPNTVIHRIIGTGASAYIETIDTELTARSLPQYPILPGTLDPVKVEEIRRTIYVSNISKNVSLQNLNDLFHQVAEVRFIRFAGDENEETKSAYIEFSEQPHVPRALCLNGVLFANQILRVNHATSAIVKPPLNKQVYAEKAQSPKHHSSSRSRRSRSKSRKRSSRSRSRKRSSRSKSRKRSSRSKSRHRSRSKSKRSHSRKKSKSPRRRSSRTPKKSSRDRENDKSRRGSSKPKKRKRSRSKDSKKRRS